MIRRVDEVTGALEQLADVLAQEEELAVILGRVCQQGAGAIPDADMVSISLLRDGQPFTAAATNERADIIDQAQYDAGQGPCLESAKTGQIVRVVVSEVAERWPEFARVAGDAAVASYLSSPLFIDNEYHGSLNVYGQASHGFGVLDEALLELYTTATETALRTARLYLKARETTEQLRTALQSRAVIDQAKGIIMAVRRISADAAFAILVEQSQDQNLKVREVAERFVTNIVNSDD